MTIHVNNGRNGRFVEAIAAGAATVEINLFDPRNKHAITVKVLDTNGDEVDPTGGTAAIWFKVHKDDDYQQLYETDGAVSINLQTGPNTYAFELPVVMLKVIGATLGANTSMVVTWNSWE